MSAIPLDTGMRSLLALGSQKTRSLPHSRLQIGNRLSVVIVNFRQWTNTLRLIRELDRSEVVRDGLAEIQVVDNHTTPSGVVPETLTHVRVHRMGGNGGFARGVNHALRRSQAEWTLVLNPDISLKDEFLDRVDDLIERLAESDVGIVGFQLRHSDGSPQGTAGDTPTLWRTLKGLVRPRATRKCRPVTSDSPVEADWVTGCCMLIRNRCWDDIGGVDEDFFLYYEDVDLCQRAWQTGWRVMVDPTLEATHHSPLHTRRVSPLLRLVTRHALLTYARKHWSKAARLALSGIVWTEANIRRWVHQLFGRREDAKTFRRLQRLVGHHLHGREEAIRAELHRTAVELEGVEV